MNMVISGFNAVNGLAAKLLDLLQPLALLGARAYVAWVFFKAGLSKVRDWESTLFLFEYEYQVPFISHELAAYLGTAGEIVLPVFVVLGLLGRLSAIGLSVVNIVAVISLSDIPAAALLTHIVWGCLLAAVVLFGAGKLSLDYLFARNSAHPDKY